MKLQKEVEVAWVMGWGVKIKMCVFVLFFGGVTASPQRSFHVVFTWRRLHREHWCRGESSAPSTHLISLHVVVFLVKIKLHFTLFSHNKYNLHSLTPTSSKINLPALYSSVSLPKIFSWLSDYRRICSFWSTWCIHTSSISLTCATSGPEHKTGWDSIKPLCKPLHPAAAIACFKYYSVCSILIGFRWTWGHSSTKLF